MSLHAELVMRVVFVQESVRAAAAILLRTLRGLTLRLVDPSHTPKGEAVEAVNVVLPFLVKGGKHKPPSSGLGSFALSGPLKVLANNLRPRIDIQEHRED